MPGENRTTQTAGPYPIQCFQATPGWFELVGQPVGNRTDIPTITPDHVPAVGKGETEDCLVLDILAPKSVLSNKASSNVAVLVNIHGGGFVVGSKTYNGPGIGFLEAAARNGIDLVYVSINYRLGLFVSTHTERNRVRQQLTGITLGISCRCRGRRDPT